MQLKAITHIMRIDTNLRVCSAGKKRHVGREVVPYLGVYICSGTYRNIFLQGHIISIFVVGDGGRGARVIDYAPWHGGRSRYKSPALVYVKALWNYCCSQHAHHKFIVAAVVLTWPVHGWPCAWLWPCPPSSPILRCLVSILSLAISHCSCSHQEHGCRGEGGGGGHETRQGAVLAADMQTELRMLHHVEK